MSAASCAEELDFTLMFEADGGDAADQTFDVRTSSSSAHVLAGLPLSQELQGQTSCFSSGALSQNVGYQPQGSLRAFECPSIQITSIAPNNQMEAGVHQEVEAVQGAEGGFPEPSWSRDQLYLPLDPCYRDPALCPSPGSSLSSRSWMSDVSSCESFAQVYDDMEGELRTAARLGLDSPYESPLGSPGCGGGAFGVELWQQKYQHPAAYSPSFSPYQSPRQSPCHSPRTSITEDSWLNRRPTSRPSSRPTSPCGKRRHFSADRPARSPSPHHSFSPTPGASPRGSVTDETWAGSPGFAPLLMSGYQELDVPSKTRKTSGGQPGFPMGQSEPGSEPFPGSPSEEGRERDDLAELFLQVPSHFSWGKPKPGNPPLFRASSPPPLDWPLPSQHQQCELKVEVQPKSYHRAHYETEGSRGSIKAATGGHPVVTLNGFSEQPLSLLLFIGTADDRYLRPHSFYQVHRVTGKTVTTACQEKLLGCTKVLEIPLLPENNMSCSIDCAGILKLRNADIELKKGETDIGRKNTRVRVVFRVAIPQPDGRRLWLQTTSVPVECSQRSGQDLPQVESVSVSSGSVDGGEEMIVTGSNISAHSRVVFMEKGPDGRALWEMDAKVLSGKSSGAAIVVETPPYSKSTKFPVHVHFYVTNGKRRRSVPQTFTYLPSVGRRTPPAPRVKQEPWELNHFSHNPPGFCPAAFQSPSLQPDYNSRHPPAEGILSSQSAPHLHQPPSSYVLQQTPPLFPHSSSMPSHISSIASQNLIPFQTSSPQATVLPPQTSILPPQTSILPPQTSILPPQTTILPPQTSILPPQTTILPPQTSILPLQTSILPPQTTVLPPQTFSPPPVARADPLKGSVEALSIKQEPLEQSNLGSLRLQEITLDDVNEIIDRDIGSRGELDQPDQYQYRDPESGEAALPPCGGPQ